MYELQLYMKYSKTQVYYRIVSIVAYTEKTFSNDIFWSYIVHKSYLDVRQGRAIQSFFLGRLLYIYQII